MVDIGLAGLAVMGQNLALNMKNKGFTVSVYNRTAAKTEGFVKEKGKGLLPAYSLQELVDSLKTPRKIFLMVKSGRPVDDMIEQLKPLLSEGDLIVDGGNSFFKDTIRREKSLENEGLFYLGTGISGGEEGALHGPSIMPGGSKKAYTLMEPILTGISAQLKEGPCCAYLGSGGAGHYVKMVHNGIEYGLMQLLAETYDLLRNSLGMSPLEISCLLETWNQGELGSYLLEITVDLLRKTDPEDSQPLIDKILDTAAQKGTGKWTSQSALDLGVAVNTIDAALHARIISGCREERQKAAEIFESEKPVFEGNKERFVKNLKNGLYAAFLVTYAQGMALLKAASAEYCFDLCLADIAGIWKGGCIIRARILDRIKQVFAEDPHLDNLLLSKSISLDLTKLHPGLRQVVQTAVGLEVPVSAMSASLDYFDAYRTARSAANLVAAQRDYFGAHTYRRLDKEGTFHTNWTD